MAAKNAIYKNALQDKDIFPNAQYKLEEIIEILERNIGDQIPSEDREYREDKSIPKWRSTVHTTMRDLSRVKLVSKETYEFS